MEQAKITEIRWHGRGGQGAVTSAEMIALAAINEGKFAQAFPSFGPERRGAPVLAFNRVSTTSPIKLRAAVIKPDIVVVLDQGLLTIMDVTAGMKANGILIINTSKTIDDIKSDICMPCKVAIVNATIIARKLLGVPIVNTTMLGALIKATKIVALESLVEPIGERFGGRAKSNIDACNKAYEQTLLRELTSKELKGDRSFPKEKLLSWKELPPGCVVTEAGSAKQYRTGDWASEKSTWDFDKCIKCGLCYLFCPEGCIRQKEDGYFQADYYYCKGCGICSQECPTKAITMVEV
jgi:pyruvate ferredoxin oxidoreductase gamma subunit